MQRLRRLLTRRSVREAEGAFVVEGAKLLAEALDAGSAIEAVYLDPTAVAADQPLITRCLDAGLRVYDLEPGVLARVADTVTPQPVLAVVPMVDVSLDRALAGTADSGAGKAGSGGEAAVADQGTAGPGAAGLGAAGAAGPGAAGLVVALVDLRDPGNAGSVLRSADAAGVDAVIFCEGSVDLYNPKTVRASAGAVFHVPVVVGLPAAEALAGLGRAGLARLGTVVRDGVDYTSVDLRRPTAVVLGNEANGLSEEIGPFLDGSITIPMAGRAESLNVGMAAAVVCFEAARQRRQSPTGDPRETASIALPPT